MECDLKSKKMVATLLSRKDALEAKLGEKTLELKKLCIQEAELTGILPPETPIEPGESPPVFRRRIDTAFTYQEISKLKSKEEEALAKLEVECKVQTSVAEAALALANDLNAGKSIRRKHRLEYQQSQRRLTELEMRLHVLRQSIKSGSQIKQRKKPRPPFVIESDCSDCVDGPELAPDDLSGHYNHMLDKPSTLPSISRDAICNSHFYNSFGKASHTHGHLLPRSYQPMSTNQWNRNQQYRRSVERSQYNSAYYDENTNWLEDASSWRNTAPPVDYFPNQCYTALTLPSESTRGAKSRYGSLDRRYRNSHHSISENRYPGGGLSRASPTLSSPLVYPDSHSPNCIPLSPDCGVPSAVLLPNQTYPENSLMRTQSLGNVEPSKKALDTHSLQEKVQENFLCSTLGRRSREKGWRETALDTESYERLIETPPLRQKRMQTPPLHPRASKMADNCVPQRPISMRETRTPPPPPLPPPHCPVAVARSSPLPAVVSRSPVKSPVIVAETVPLESPKNHTVVEVGKWQPYREVTKPFEMSDFYKYSTKFRKSGDQGTNKEGSCEESPNHVGVAKTHLESLQENLLVTSNEDINKNSMNKVPYLNPDLMKNITHRRYRPLMAVNDRNENIVKQWCNEA